MDSLEVGRRYLLPRRVLAAIESCFHAESGLRCRRANQGNDGFPADERTTTPVLCDVGEEPVLDLIPLARSWWKVTDVYFQPAAIGESLELHTPQSGAGGVAAATIGGDEQLGGVGVRLRAHLAPPAFERRDRELRGVVVDADAKAPGPYYRLFSAGLTT